MIAANDVSGFADAGNKRRFRIRRWRKRSTFGGSMMEQKNEVPQQPFSAFGTPILSAVRI
ncbi:hypothetical protein CD191_19275 [Paenibacillus odorifer]|uniref:Uncharacterized protein n=1 Tax=Paenibacillus odorifer TaxID=189426 RepID=A0AAD0KJZ9_9BACL|nr:hypothetical protein CD191_19275 [Paenibacillus odorifer]